jgi:hypothetical protein
VVVEAGGGGVEEEEEGRRCGLQIRRRSLSVTWKTKLKPGKGDG